MSQNNLGLSLWRRWTSTQELGHLTEAVSCLEAALLERTFDNTPLEWSFTKMNLAQILEDLAKATDDVARLHEARSTYLEARTVFVQLEGGMLTEAVDARLNAIDSALAEKARAPRRPWWRVW